MHLNKLLALGAAALVVVGCGNIRTSFRQRPGPSSATTVATPTIKRVPPSAIPPVFRPVAAQARKLGVPLYVPTTLPPAPLPHGAWSLVHYAIDAHGYRFSLLWTAKAYPPNAYRGGVPGAGFVFTMATPKGPLGPTRRRPSCYTNPRGRSPSEAA